ncbi:MAG: DNRLRE domain-containing protein [Fibrobacteres bacterium]|nr:DNRLRE domain-containing protein [Fibrobacterota bacterium]
MLKVLSFTTITSLLLVFSVQAADLDLIRDNTIKYLTAAGADTADPVFASAIAGLEDSVRAYMAACRIDGSWPDINYAAPIGQTPWEICHKHYFRMMMMSYAFRVKGSALYFNDTLLQSIQKAINRIELIVYAGVTKGGNPWYWNQGLPLYYSPTLLLMEGYLDSATQAKSLATLTYCMPAPSNYVDMGDRFVQSVSDIHFALLTRDTARLALALSKGKSALGSASINLGGLRPDYSYVHHDIQLYTGGYGAQVAEFAPRYCIYTKGTAYALPAAYFDNLVAYMAEATQWAFYQNYYDVSVVGRNITRAGLNGEAGFTGIVTMACLPNSRQTEFQKSSKQILATWNFPISVQLAAFASQVMKSPVTTGLPSGHKHYFATDYTVHRRPGYFMSVKMCSPEVGTAECVNGEGKKSWHLSDGMTMLLRRGDEYMTNNVWASMDWTRLPGTTIEQKPRINFEDPIYNYRPGRNAFVGGVSCGPFGASAMNFSGVQSALSAKKSWFFFENEMVALGSAVTCTTANISETIINQRPLSSSSIPLIADGSVVTPGLGWSGTLSNISWAACDSMGYYFPGGATIKGKVDNQSGKWSDIGFGDNIVRTNPMATLWFDHGANAANSSYAYAVLPNRSSSDMAAYALNPAIRVAVNSDTLQAVENTLLGATGAVFWQKGEYGVVKADSPCVAFWRVAGDSFIFSAAYPLHTTPTIKFTFSEPYELKYSSQSVTFSNDGVQSFLTFQSLQGRDLMAVFRRPPKASGYVRITVLDSALLTPISSASCAVTKSFGASGSTNAQGVVVIYADTGNNVVTALKSSWRTATVSPVFVRPGETTHVNIRLSKLPYVGIRLMPSSITMGLSDGAGLKVVGVYPDSSVDTLTGSFVWNIDPPALASINSSGIINTGMLSGSGTVRCSSLTMSYTATAALLVRPVVIIRALEDSYVRGGSYAGTNFGADTLLVVRGSSDPEYLRKTYLKFDLSKLAGLTIDSAKFKIYANNTTPLSKACEVKIYAETAAVWTENSVTWRNQPTLSEQLGSLFLSSNMTSGWCSATLTKYLKERLAAGKPLSIGLLDTVVDGLYLPFRSSENSLLSPIIEISVQTSQTAMENSLPNIGTLSLSVQPNPFNPSTALSVNIPHGNKRGAQLSIINTRGELVREWILNPGTAIHQVVWNGKDVRGNAMATGIYFTILKYDKQTKAEKMILIR